MTAKNNQEYVSELEEKIRSQAKRLCEMQNYIEKCEKQIFELKSKSPLSTINSNKRSNFVESRMIDDIAKLKAALNQKEKENANLHDRLSFLQDTLNAKSEIDYVSEEEMPNNPNDLRRQLLISQKTSTDLKKERGQLAKKNKELLVLQKKTEDQNKALKNAIHSNLLNYDLDKVMKGSNGHKLKRDELVNAFVEITDLMKSREEVIKDNIYCNELIEQLREVVDDLTKRNSQLSEEKNNFDNHVSEIKYELESKAKELEKTEVRLTRVVQEKEELFNHVSELEEKFDILSVEFKKNERELSKLRRNAKEELETKEEKMNESMDKLKVENEAKEESS